jgi:hypothetical protein
VGDTGGQLIWAYSGQITWVLTVINKNIYNEVVLMKRFITLIISLLFIITLVYSVHVRNASTYKVTQDKIPIEGAISFEEVLEYDIVKMDDSIICEPALIESGGIKKYNISIQKYVEEHKKESKKFSYFISTNCKVTSIQLVKERNIYNENWFAPKIDMIKDAQKAHLYKTQKLYFGITVSANTCFYGAGSTWSSLNPDITYTIGENGFIKGNYKYAGKEINVMIGIYGEYAKRV